MIILDQGGGYCSPCNTIWKNVDKLPSLGEASRNHAYILPDNTVWILNHDGTEFIAGNSGGDNQTIDLSSKQDKLKAGKNITIENDVISSTADNDLKTAVDNLKSSKQDKVTFGDGFYIHEKNGETIIDATSPRNIKRYVISTTSEYEGINSPFCVLTVETVDSDNDFIRIPTSIGEMGSNIITIDINTNYHIIDKDKDEESYVINLPHGPGSDEVAIYLNEIIQKHSQIVVGEITLDFNPETKVLTFRGLSRNNQNRAYTATYYSEYHLAFP